MLLKNIIGLSIIVLNIAGLGFIFYMLVMKGKEKFFPIKQIPTTSSQKKKPKKPAVANENLIDDDEDLLKDLDLNDLDDIDLDDFD